MNSTTDALRELLLPKLDGVRPSGNGYSARCPAHNDTNASLMVAAGRDQPVVLHCHAGCSAEDVLGNLGLTWADLSSPRQHAGDDTWMPCGHTKTAEYSYTDASGALLYAVARCDRKGNDCQGFRQWRPDPIAKSGRRWNLNEVTRVLYRLPEVAAEVARSGLVWVVEGEKDVHTLEAQGMVATTCPMGAGKWRPEFSATLVGAAVIVVADRDDPGRAHARHVRDSLIAAGVDEVEVKEPAEGKDVTEHLAAGLDLADLVDVDKYGDWLNDDPGKSFDAQGDRSVQEPDAEPQSRLEQLRAQLLDTQGLDKIPEPEALVPGILFRDSPAWLFGKPGCGKSFVAIDIAGCIGTGEPWQGFLPATQGSVLYIVAEGAMGIKKRVRAWEASMGRRMTGVLFLPVAVQVSNAADWDAVVALAAEIQPALVVVDTQARVTVGMEENSNTDMGLVVHRIEALRRASRACVLTVHHTGRDGEHLRGAIAIEGAATTTIKIERDQDVLTVSNPKQKEAAELDAFRLRLISYEESAIVSLIDGPLTVDLGQPAVRKMLAEWWNSHETDWVSVSILIESKIATKPTFYRNAKPLENAGHVEKTGTKNSTRYRLTRRPTL